MEEVIESKNTINDKAQLTAAQSAQTSVVMPETGARSKTSAKPQERSVNMHRSSNKGSARPKSRGRNRKTNIGARGTSAFPVGSLGATMQDMKDPEMDKDLNKHIFHVRTQIFTTWCAIKILSLVPSKAFYFILAIAPAGHITLGRLIKYVMGKNTSLKKSFQTGQLAMLGDCLSELIQDFNKATFTWKVNPANGMPFVRIENGTGCCLDMEIQGEIKALYFYLLPSFPVSILGTSF